MVTISKILYYLKHYDELRSIIQWTVSHEPVHKVDWSEERPTLQQCFLFLQKTSRSFAAVIVELHPELLVPVALFYLVLRGLDTIEDDMTIDLEEKERLLRDFHNVIEKEGWNYKGNGPDEKDRDLLVHFDVVVAEFRRIKPEYRAIIRDITQKMGHGMADYAKSAALNTHGIDTLHDYNLYCHYVAGLVGEGLTRLFVQSELAKPALLERPQLQESMGLFLQKTNIIRDVREDWNDGRRFWPRAVWAKHVARFEQLFEPAHERAALACASEMVLDALAHADECLVYLAGVREQSVFNFAAIPQAMAVATLALVFRNPRIFRENVKITRGQSCQLMIESSQNLQVLTGAFRRCLRTIRKKNTPDDPNFIQISVACGKIEQFIETVFPSQDRKDLAAKARGEPTTDEKKRSAQEKEARTDMLYMLGSMLLVLAFLTAIMLGIAYLAGARFDIALAELRKGRFALPNPGEARKIREQYDDHTEL